MTALLVKDPYSSTESKKAYGSGNCSSSRASVIFPKQTRGTDAFSGVTPLTSLKLHQGWIWSDLSCNPFCTSTSTDERGKPSRKSHPGLCSCPCSYPRLLPHLRLKGMIRSNLSGLITYSQNYHTFDTSVSFYTKNEWARMLKFPFSALEGSPFYHTLKAFMSGLSCNDRAVWESYHFVWPYCAFLWTDYTCLLVFKGIKLSSFT